MEALEAKLCEYTQLLSDSQRFMSIAKEQVEVAKKDKTPMGQTQLKGALMVLAYEQNRCAMAQKMVMCVQTAISNVMMRGVAKTMREGALRIDIERHNATGIVDTISDANDHFGEVVGGAEEMAQELQGLQDTPADITVEQLMARVGMAMDDPTPPRPIVEDLVLRLPEVPRSAPARVPVLAK